MTMVLAGSCARTDVLGRAHSRSLAQASEDVALDGTMVVLIEDSDQSSRTLYFLISGERRVTLRFLKTPANLTTGTRVRVHGQWDGSVLVVASFERI